MAKIKAVGIIRQRGQITIPETIRRAAQWADPLKAVNISLEEPHKIVITPHTAAQDVNWEELWKELDTVSKFPGKRGNLSEFIAQDRQTRR